MQKSDITIDKLLDIFYKKNYQVFESQAKPYNINIFGVRSNDINSNAFNDFIGLFWKQNDQWILKVYEATTKAGIYWRENPMNVGGTGTLVPKQYLGAYQIGMFHLGYLALLQVKPMKAYRDNNKDDIIDIDPKTITEGLYGCDIHHAYQSDAIQLNNNWSAMCQVIEKISDWNEFFALCQDAVHYWGNSLTYTLIEEKDFAITEEKEVA